MSSAQLFSATIESLLNTVLSLDEQSAERLKPLSGKHLTIALNELPQPFTLAFSDKVDVLIANSDSQPSVDCRLQLSIMTLQELQDTSQIMRLIKEEKLLLEGDMHVAQQFSALLKDLNIDWEEHLSKYIGDVAAHQLWHFASNLKATVKQQLQQASQIIKEGAVEEKQLTPHEIEVNKFVDDVHDLRSDVEHLEARVLKLCSTHSKQSQQD